MSPAAAVDATAGGALELSGLRKSFGAVCALDGIDLRFQPGELCGLIGPNGSGKSTLFDCCTGLTQPDEGAVLLDGADITSWPQHRIALAGRLRRSFQRNVVLGSMTVTENLLLAGQMQAMPGMAATFLHGAANRRRMDALRTRAGELLDLVDLRRVQSAPAGELSVGQQKLLQFAATLMSSPRVVMLDEPFAGVNPVLIERLVTGIRWANASLPATIIVIEHNIEELFSLCRRVMVMNAGELIADGTPDQVAADERVVKAYLGT
ncbi:MAG: ABC transporter ATP-binding protein [Burkholderiales bacterium]